MSRCLVFSKKYPKFGSQSCSTNGEVFEPSSFPLASTHKSATRSPNHIDGSLQCSLNALAINMSLTMSATTARLITLPREVDLAVRPLSVCTRWIVEAENATQRY